MRIVQIAVTATFIMTGAYLGLCVGQAVSYYAGRFLLRDITE